MELKRMRTTVLLITVAVVFLCPVSQLLAEAQRKLLAVEGNGYLETVDGYPVLHLKGAPEQMGYQHGVLLKKSIRENIEFLLNDALDQDIKIGTLKITSTMIASVLLGAFDKKVPQHFVDEMNALAKGAELPEWKIKVVNLIPEMMHCSGFALLSKATAENKLYHGRVLDYGVKMKLQNHAVLIIQEPDGKVPFVNVSYAGFIGSVTGMNLAKISIGEMGGGGVGQWDGIPMSFLVRMVLEDTRTLEEAIGIFKDNPRTCEYYYVIADAAADNAVGIKALPDKLEIIRHGETHPQLQHPVENTVIMSAGDRYNNLARLIAEGYGKFTQASAIRLMDAPVAMNSNLHDALMVPEDAVIYVANARPDGSPAWKQKYYRFDIRSLMRQKPENR